MSQHDFNIANQTASNARADINNAFKALASLSSGSTAPSTTYANMLWYDDANNILKMRSEADDAWINVGYLDQSSNAFRILDDTQVVNTSGTQTGLLGGQSEATWEAGTGTTEGLVSPAKIKAAIDANASSPVKAWVNFDGTGTVAINESFNVSSITDNGTGKYSINFTTALADANYAAACMAQRSVSSSPVYVGYTPSTTPTVNGFQITVAATASNIEDSPTISAIVTR